MERKKNDILQGTLAMLVLKTLATRGSIHGYAITQHIQEASAELLRVEEGSLYPALHRLESQGLIQSTWGVSDNNRRARFYQLTPRGRKQVTVRISDWRRMVEAINRVIDPLES